MGWIEGFIRSMGNKNGDRSACTALDEGKAIDPVYVCGYWGKGR